MKTNTKQTNKQTYALVTTSNHKITHSLALKKKRKKYAFKRILNNFYCTLNNNIERFDYSLNLKPFDFLLLLFICSISL